jgi:ASC-1-like (ASCH) protein
MVKTFYRDVEDNWFDHICSGSKTVEMYMFPDHICTANHGDIIVFTNNRDNRQIKVRIEYVKLYNTVLALFVAEDIQHIYPMSKNIHEILSKCREHKSTVIAIKFQVISM